MVSWSELIETNSLWSANRFKFGNHSTLTFVSKNLNSDTYLDLSLHQYFSKISTPHKSEKTICTFRINEKLWNKNESLQADNGMLKTNEQIRTNKNCSLRTMQQRISRTNFKRPRTVVTIQLINIWGFEWILSHKW